ncbi:uncharacterized protein [Primulina eburnea]|uniref:uncharacterized protein n=1 Tax=Primulina eburnea TaxID=1245227 RepID=UPI003C6BE9F2
MNCICWNVRGLGNQRAFRELKRLVAEKDPTLLFLCETRMKGSNIRWWKKILGFNGLFAVDCICRSGGLMLLWKDPLNIKIHSYTSGHIDCTVQQGDKFWRFTGFYGQPDTGCRHLSWNLLRRLSGLTELQGLPWIVGGDFNEICFDSEKQGGSQRPRHQIRAFRDTLDACSLQDLHSKGEFFTWANLRASNNIIFERLDRFVATIDWRLLELERDIEKLATKEELYWKQQSRVNWLANGDRNSKYFHACASLRRMKNHISGLFTAHGDWCTEPRNISEIVEHYYSNLFTTNAPTIADRTHILDCVEPKVDGDMNALICAPFTAEDIRKAVFDMHPDKAPGPDGLSVFFYQKLWVVVGAEVTEASLQILNVGAITEDWNSTIVTLIPKVKQPMTMKDFRPISLCNVCYKIVARALTNRLRPIMHHIPGFRGTSLDTQQKKRTKIICGT